MIMTVADVKRRELVEKSLHLIWPVKTVYVE